MTISRRRMTQLAMASVAMPTGFAFAQSDSDPGGFSFASGIGSPVTNYDAELNAVSTMTVTDVVANWEEYREGYGPNEGLSYALVSIEHTNLSDQEISIHPYEIRLIDGYGRLPFESWSSADNVEFFEEELLLAAGATAVTNLLFDVADGASPMMVMYLRGVGQYTFVYVGE